jgi:hypothetical protein
MTARRDPAVAAGLTPGLVIKGIWLRLGREAPA